MPKDLNQLFEELKSSYILTIETIFLERIKNAKDKAFVLDKIKNQVNCILGSFGGGIQNNIPASNNFMEYYLSGEPLTTIANKIVKHHADKLDIQPVLGPRDVVDYIPYSNAEEELLKEFPTEIKNFFGFFANYFALTEIAKRIPGYLNENKEVNQRSLTNYSVQWTGSKDKKNEFVQLVYGLHKAGLLNEGQGEITKIVETLAEAFKVDLGAGWQSNLSASIHKANKGSSPAIFSKIRVAFEQYATGLVEHKRKNS